MNEIWKDITGYEGLYQISSMGRVKRLPRSNKRANGKPLPLKEKILTGTINAFGYCRYELSRGINAASFSGHRLVAIAFIPNSNNKPQINHKNGIKTDNRVDNLEWCNNSENQKHAYAIGLNKPRSLRGDKSNLSKITKNTALAIICDLQKGLRNKDIATKYNVLRSHVSSIKSKRIWAHLQNG